MMLKKQVFGVILLIFCVSLVSAFNLSISSEPVIDSIINDWDKPAIFEFSVKNHDLAAEFEVYTSERFELNPQEFYLKKNDKGTFRIEFLPIESMRENEGHVAVPVSFKEKAGTEKQEIEIDIKIVKFANSFNLGVGDVNPDSNFVDVTFYNIENIEYDKVDLILSSAFFDDYEASFSLEAYEKKPMKLLVNEGKIKKLVYGKYIVTAVVTSEGKTETIEGGVNIINKSAIVYNEQKSGVIISSLTAEKSNKGNIPTVAEITLKKNIISRLFSTFSLEPNRVNREGFSVFYSWQEELSPDESLKVVVVTNWVFPFLLVIAVIIIIILFNLYFSRNLIIRKNVSFVKTKSNHFALKVTLHVKARKFMEKVRIYDKLPAMAKLYENFGEQPSNVDKERGRLRWDLNHLSDGESRIFTYILYSSMKVVGKFELPPATGVYELDGNIHETKSNSAFFVNEPAEPKKIEYDE